MKKFLFVLLVLLIISSTADAQKIGSTLTPFSTFGWDVPADYTTYYQLPVYRLLSNPGGWINKSQAKVDSLLHALVVYTDTTQMSIVNDSLKIIHPADAGSSKFDTTSTTKTVSLPDLLNTDVIVVTPTGTGTNTNDMLSVQYSTGSFIVRRFSGGSSGLTFNWVRIKR